MAKVYAHMGIGSVSQLFYFADQRIIELEKIIEEAKNEKEMWETLKKKLNPCTVCHGRGEIGYPDPDPLEQRTCYKKCEACDGSGEEKKHA